MQIAAVIVTHFPELERLRSLVVRLRIEGTRVIVVDNGSQLQEHLDLPGEPLRQEEVQWIFNRENRGIGAAQNQGIQLALAGNSEFITVFDQDSSPAAGMLATLAATCQHLRAQGCAAAAVGPLLIDEGSGKRIPFITYRNGSKHRVVAGDNDGPVECFSLLASGTMFCADVFQTVGLMDEGLFLEYVDIEWGARATSRGYKLYGVPTAHLQHNLGEHRIPLWAGLSIPLHSPVRHYYTFRNAVALQHRRYIPSYWKRADFIRCLVLFFLFAILNKPRFEQVRMMLKGVHHGFLGIEGPYRATPIQGLKTS
jgi:rhamnosyltransferase